MATTATYPAPTAVSGRIANETLATWLVVTLALAAFGPYVIGPVRTEQMAVYGLGALVLPLAWPRLRAGAGAGIVVAWVAFLYVALLGVLFPYRGPQPWEPGSVLAGIDNLLLPLVVMALVWSTVRADVAPRVLDRFARVVIWGAAANGVLAVLSTRLPLDTFLRPFWSAAGGITTAELAAGNGRISGIFNHPAEAGIVYGVAGLLALYLYHDRPRPLFTALIPILIGGLFTVSKIFLFGGLPIILFVLVRQPGKNRLMHLFLAAAGGLLVLQSGIMAQWVGRDFLLRRLIPSGDADLVAFYSAGRWNDGSLVQTAIRSALEINPWGGVGVGGWAIPYDSAWTESIIIGGILGAACYAVTLALFGLVAVREADPRRRLLMITLAVLLAGATLGISPLTVNRVATLVWVLIALLIRAHRPVSHPDPTRGHFATHPAEPVPPVSLTHNVVPVVPLQFR